MTITFQGHKLIARPVLRCNTCNRDTVHTASRRTCLTCFVSEVKR